MKVCKETVCDIKHFTKNNFKVYCNGYQTITSLLSMAQYQNYATLIPSLLQKNVMHSIVGAIATYGINTEILI